MYRFSLWLLLLPLILFANTAITENDPSTLVDNVSVITGNFYSFDEDYVVQGYEPIRLRRSYISGEAHSLDTGSSWTSCCLLPRARIFWIIEPNGTLLTYRDTGELRDGKLLFKPIDFDSLPGVSNTARGKISAENNLKNQHLLVTPRDQGEPKQLTLVTANGTRRDYTNKEGQKKEKAAHGGKEFFFYYYRLVSEDLPNGNKIHYRWDHDNQLREIRTTNREGTLLFAKLHCPYFQEKSSRLEYSGSDGRSLLYECGSLCKDIWGLRKIHSPEFPLLSHDYLIREKKIKKKQVERTPLADNIYFVNGRNIYVEYEENPPYRVKKLSARVGTDETAYPIQKFFYEQGNITHVFDALDNKTVYQWNHNSRINSIDYYRGHQDIFFGEDYLWDDACLYRKSHHSSTRASFSRCFTYDGAGNLKEERFWDYSLKNSNCWTKKFSYNSRNLLTQEKDGDLVTLYDYRDDSNLPLFKIICERDSPKIRTDYEYSPERFLIREVTQDSICKTIRQITPRRAEPYVGLPEIIEERYGEDEALLGKTILRYREGALISEKEIYDADNQFRYKITYDYDNKGRITAETNALGQQAISQYDELGNRSYYRDFSGRIEVFCRYDYSNRLIEKKEVGFDGIERIYTYSYDKKHNLTSETDFRGHTTHYKSSPFGQREETIYPSVPNEKGELITATLLQSYDSLNNEILHTDPENNITKTTYTAQNKPFLLIHPNGSQEENTYHPDGTLQIHKDARGVITTYEYDYLKRVTKKTIGTSIEVFSYEGAYLVYKIDPENHKTTYRYDKAGRKIAEECGGEEILFSYDTLGRLARIQQGDLLSITEYDLLNRVTLEQQETTSGELLRKTLYEYDAAGNRACITRFVAGTTTHEHFQYDSQNRLIQRTDPLGQSETIHYNDHFLNPFAQPVLQKTHTDALGLQTIETHDVLGRVARIEKRKEGKTLAATDKFYNKAGQIQFQLDTVYAPDGTSRLISTRWIYTHGHLTKLIEADSKITTYAYTARGELQQLTKPDGVILTYAYNDLGDLKTLTSSDNTVDYQMSYTNTHLLLESKGLTRTYDHRGRLKTETFPAGFSVENQYDPSSGKRILCHLPQADCSIQYSYQGSNLQSVTRSNSHNYPLYTHTYTQYDLSGNLLRTELIGPLGSLHFEVDSLSRRTRMLAPHFEQKILEFDSVGNIRQMQRQGETFSYDYDDLYQLTREAAHRYTYDSLHNRLSKDQKTYQINSLNQLVSHLKYNPNGSPIQCGNTRYTYDALDRLIRLETPTHTQTFAYDCLHRCLTQTTTSSTQTQTLHFLYDGQNEIGAFDAELQLQQLRILGTTPHAEIGAAIALELGGNIYAPIHDLQGNVAALLPLHTEEPTFYRYTAFGEEEIAGLTANPWRFSSKRTDPITGLVSYGRRFYVPDLGRWLTPDPAGFTAGMNLYQFVSNNPLIHWDEYGLLDFGQHKWREDKDYEEKQKAVIHGLARGLWQGFVHPIDTTWSISGDLSQITTAIVNWDFSALQQSWESMNEIERLSFSSERLGQLAGAPLGVGPFLAKTIFQKSMSVLGTKLLLPQLRKKMFSSSASFIAKRETSKKFALAPAKRVSGQTVLGHYPEYVQQSEQLLARRFQVPKEFWNRMTIQERLEANKKFLNRTILRKDEILLATPPTKMKPGSSFQWEVEYLKDKGYNLHPYELKLLPPEK